MQIRTYTLRGYHGDQTRTFDVLAVVTGSRIIDIATGLGFRTIDVNDRPIGFLLESPSGDTYQRLRDAMQRINRVAESVDAFAAHMRQYGTFTLKEEPVIRT